ncbi:MAG: response regulator [Polyangiaceae bacterium]|nr:response regulator [Polyangiaceae bacterium]
MSSVAHIWGRILAWAVPPGLAEADPDTARRARLVTAMLLIIAPPASFIGLVHAIRGSALQAVVLLAGVLIAGGSIAYLRRTGRVRVVGNISAAVVFVGITVAVGVRGGSNAQSIMVLSMAPLIAVFVAGVKDGLWWTVATMVEPPIWVLLERLGLRIPDQMGTDGRWIVSLTLPTMFIAAVVSVSIAYVKARDAAVSGRVAAEVERQKALRDVESARADRMNAIGQLAAGVAHEINNPLAYVVGNLTYIHELLTEHEQECARDPELHQALVESLQGALRAQRIVGDLRAYARVDPERIEPTDVRRALSSSLQLVFGELKHRARVTEEYDDDVPLVAADESRLAQVFVNVLVNAAHALPEGRAEEHEVRLRLKRSADGVVVEISDTGEGIAEEALPHVFEPFFTTKAPGQGTGLGLSACKGVVDGYGGRIEIESTVGAGTTVRVVLPPVKASSMAPPEPEAELEPKAVVARRILVVDDEPLVRRSLGRMLRRHSVTAASSGREALELLSHESFDIIFCDLMMPDLTGMDVYDALHARGDGLVDKLVFVSGGAFTERARAFVDSIANPCLDKPFDPTRVEQLVAAAPTAQRLAGARPSV